MSQGLSTATLKSSIDTFMESVAKHAPPEVLTGLGAEVTKLAESGIALQALQVGEEAPDFTLPDAHGKPVSLSALLARGPAVVTFYRGSWCPFCDLQLRAYQGALGAIRDLGAELVAVSPQTPDYALSDVEKKELTFPVLTDEGNRVAREFKLVFTLSDTLRKLQTHFGSVLPKFNGDDSWELPMPGTFVIDRHGVVWFASVDPNWMVRVEPAAILAALRAVRS
jgi:peroxiredoxin